MITSFVLKIVTTLCLMLGVGILSAQNTMHNKLSEDKNTFNIECRKSITSEIETEQTYTFKGNFDIKRLDKIDNYLETKLGEPAIRGKKKTKTWVLGEEQETPFTIEIKKNGVKIFGSVNDETINLVRELVNDIKTDL